ncbi:MAG: hypothetical protein R2818_08915 [Flavobacteriales bacterium]
MSKRTYLDIASVNSAARFEMDSDVILEARKRRWCEADPKKYLVNTSAFLAREVD